MIHNMKTWVRTTCTWNKDGIHISNCLVGTVALHVTVEKCDLIQ